MRKHLSLITKIVLWAVVITMTYASWTLGENSGVIAGCAGMTLASWEN